MAENIMSDQYLIKTKAPILIQGETPAELLRTYFAPHSDLTYRTIDDIDISNINLYQSLLTGSLVRKSRFTNGRFERADLDGVRIEDTEFTDCDFSKADLRSSHFLGCKFESTSLAEAFINDCFFDRCSFINCSFEGASFTKSRLSKTSFSNSTLTQATFIHNKLFECEWSSMMLGNCTFLYLIMRNCLFQNVTMNADAIGAIFGLELAQVDEFNLMFLGKDEVKPDGFEITDLLSHEIERRGWYIGQLSLDLNFRRRPIIQAFEVYCSKTFDRFVKMGFAKGDEIEYVADIIDELSFLNRLPLLTVARMLDWCKSLGEALVRADTHEVPRQDDAVRSLATRLSVLYYQMLDDLEDSLSEASSMEQSLPVRLQAKFNEEPSLKFTDLLNSIASIPELNIDQRTSLINSYRGSYIEVVYSTLFTVFALKVFLFLINGCLIQLTEVKERVKVLKQKKTSKAYSEMAIVPKQKISPSTQHLLQVLTQFTKKLGWLSDPTLKGFDATNVQEMELLPVTKQND